MIITDLKEKELRRVSLMSVDYLYKQGRRREAFELLQLVKDLTLVVYKF